MATEYTNDSTLTFSFLRQETTELCPIHDEAPLPIAMERGRGRARLEKTIQ